MVSPILETLCSEQCVWDIGKSFVKHCGAARPAVE